MVVCKERSRIFNTLSSSSATNDSISQMANGKQPAITPLDSEKQTNINFQYNHRKPKWWKNVSGKPTKGQKRAMQEILITHRLPVVPYGEFIEWFDFFPKGNDIWLEIGFGQGENLLALAHRKRREAISFVGAEIHRPGIGTACRRMQEGIDNKKFWNEYETFSPVQVVDASVDACDILDDKSISSIDSERSNPYKNLRLHTGDGVKLLPFIPPSSVAAVLVTFPDPFPKENQAQWRVVQTHTVLQVHRILRESGTFFLATDHDGFNDWAHCVMESVNGETALFCKVEPCPDRLEWLPVVSKYEKKGWSEGRRTTLSCWRKVNTSGG
eukprot:scaffold1083_cov114-Cylindrotheca_fusiformis.AAC.5